MSVNPGELVGRIPNGENGSVPGWEAAGTVVGAASDGSGPRVGENVLTFGDDGGWAQFRAVPSALVGVLPVGADFGAASTLPIAAGSALRSIRTLGPVLGTRVMITGATGAVGRFGVQLAARAGADVVAFARDKDRHDELLELGASEVHSDLTDSISAVPE